MLLPLLGVAALTIALVQYMVSQDQGVDPGRLKAAVGVPRRADDRLAADVEAGVDQHRTPRAALELLQQPGESRMTVLVHRLNAGSVIDMGHRRDRGADHTDAAAQVRVIVHDGAVSRPQ